MKILNADLEIQKTKEQLSLCQEQLQKQTAKRDAVSSEKRKAAYQKAIQKTEQDIQNYTALLHTLETAPPYISFLEDVHRMKKIFDEMNETLKAVSSVRYRKQLQHMDELLCDGFEILSSYLPEKDQPDLEKQDRLYRKLRSQIHEEYQNFIQNLIKYPERFAYSWKQKEIAQKYDIQAYFADSMPYLYPCACLEILLRQPDILDSLCKAYTAMYQNDPENHLPVPAFLNSLPYHLDLLP